MNCDDMEELVERKKELKDELKEVEGNIRKIKSRRNLNSPTVNMRVPTSFMKECNYINDKREEFGLDGLSFPKILELIPKHVSWKKLMRNDLIKFNTNLENNGGIIYDAVSS